MFESLLIIAVLNSLSLFRVIALTYYFMYIPRKAFNRVYIELMKKRGHMLALPIIKYQQLKKQIEKNSSKSQAECLSDNFEMPDICPVCCDTYSKNS